ncbi:hypothetical protein ABHN01_03045 [Fictibacillus sp. NRS-1165]
MDGSQLCRYPRLHHVPDLSAAASIIGAGFTVGFPLSVFSIGAGESLDCRVVFAQEEIDISERRFNL